MGVDPGHPDFRGADGFLRAYPALATAGLDLSTSPSCRAPFTTFLGLPGAFRASAEPLSPSGAARGLRDLEDLHRHVPRLQSKRRDGSSRASVMCPSGRAKR